MSRRTRIALVVGAAVAVATMTYAMRDGSVLGGSPPLEPPDDATLALHLKGDAGLVDDVDPDIPLANATDHPIRILKVATIPDEDSPGEIQVRTFRLAGPDRTTQSISGGHLGQKDYGVPLIPAEDAVIPAGAGENDYLLLVRFAGDPDAPWSATAGLRITYEWDGDVHESTWNRIVTYCSESQMGRKFCNNLDI